MSRSKVVRRGRIKVDARKAVAKLRDHLLLDPDTWPLEVVRVAVMSGATHVRVEHDADDLRLSWDGEPPSTDALGRLLDFALESARDPHVRRLRLLAIAVNASLSTRPARVEVLAHGPGEEQAVSVSFDPSLHEEREGASGDPDAPPGEMRRGPEVLRVAASRLDGASTRVWLRKGFGWGTFVRFATRRSLREVTLLAQATQHASVPVRFEPPVPCPPRGPLVMQLDLEPHGVPGAVLEVRDDGGAAAPRATFLEHGVHLAEVSLPSTLALATESAGIHLPIDLRFDAPSWPTNASRSQVEEREAGRAVAAALEVLPEVVRALEAARNGATVTLAGARWTATQPAAIERALSALACCAAASEDDGPLAFVLDLPLARDAVGRALRPRDLVALVRRTAASAGSERLYVHRGAEALPPEFGVHAAEVPWLRGQPLEALFGSVHLRDFAEVHGEVAEGLRRRATMHALPPAKPEVPPGRRELFRFSFEETEEPLRGLSGEIVVHLRPREKPLLRVFLDERPFTTLHPEAVLPVDAAIAWPGRLRATLRHDAILDDGSLALATKAVLDRAARELSLRADRLAEADAPPEGRSLARAALASSPEARAGALADAPLWPTATGAHVSLRTLAAAVRAGALAFVQHAPDEPREAADGRVVPILDAADAVRLTAALDRSGDPALELVPYGPALTLTSEERTARVKSAHRAQLVRELQAQGVDQTVVVTFDLGHARGLAATGRQGRVFRTHAGVVLTQEATPNGAPVIVIIEEDTLLPTPGWDGVRSPEGPGQKPGGKPAARVSALVGVLQQLATASTEKAAQSDVEAALADRTFAFAPEVQAASPSAVRAWVRTTLARVRPTGKAIPRWAKGLEDVAITWMLDEEGHPVRARIADVAAKHGTGPAPFLREIPEFPTLSWGPLVVERRDARAILEAALGIALVDAEPELPKRRELARIEQLRRELMARPPIPLAAPLAGALAESPTIGNEDPKTGKTAGPVRALVALRARSVGTTPCSLRFGGRFVADLEFEGLPPRLVVAADITSANHLDRWSSLSVAGRAAVSAAARVAARNLVVALSEASKDVELTASGLGLPGALELTTSLVGEDPSLHALLRASRVLLATAFGDRVALTDALADALANDRPVLVTTRTFPPEVSSMVADPPILLGPDGEPLRLLLMALGGSLDDVTLALERATTPQALPEAKLEGPPEHPELRATLAALEVFSLTGELEISNEATSTIKVLLHDGSVRTLAPDLPFAIRGVVRPLRIDSRPRALRDLGETLAAAAWTLLRGIAPRLDELPPLARRAVLRTVLSATARGEKPRKELARAKAFTDLEGVHHALGELIDQRVRYTTGEPPYPSTARATKKQPAVFAMDPSWVDGLRRVGVRLVDATNDLRLDLEAEKRANAPPEEAALARAIRSRCLAVRSLAGERTGEVGLLRGDAWADAGTRVLKERRPLCALAAPEGWPIASVVNDDRLTTNRRRDGLAPTSQEEPIDAELTALRRTMMRSLLGAAPAAALGHVEIERNFRGLQVLGRLWLLPESEEASVSVRWAGEGSNERTLTLEAPSPASPAYPSRLPIGGDLFVVPGTAKSAFDAGVRLGLGRLAVEALRELVRDVPGNAQARARVLWHAVLLGAAVSPPALLDVAGKTQVGASVLTELRRRGCLWVSRHAGLAEGEFPDEAPAFVLLDDGRSPLLELLAERAPSLVRELGGLPASGDGDEDDGAGSPSPSPSGSDSSSETGPKKRRRKKRKKRGGRDEAAGAPARPSPTSSAAGAAQGRSSGVSVETSEAGDAAEGDAAKGSSWLQRLGSAVTDVVRGGPRVVLPADHPLARALGEAMRRLGTTDAPPVVAVPRGRPVRWNEEAGELRVVLEHPSVAALLADGEIDLLVATAIGELNRARHSVSDVEEARVVADLLAARADRA